MIWNFAGVLCLLSAFLGTFYYMKEMFPGSFPSDVLQGCPADGFFVLAYIFYAFYIF